MAFTSINSNGSHFARQLAGPAGEADLDVFRVFGLPADGPQLDLEALRCHYRMTLMYHVFERGTKTHIYLWKTRVMKCCRRAYQASF